MKWICRILALVLLTPCASLFAQGRYSGLWLSGDMDFGFSFTSPDYARKTEHLLHSNSSIAGGSIALGYATKRGRHSVGLGFQGAISGSPKSMSFAGLHLDLRTKPIALNDDIFLNLRVGLPISVSQGGAFNYSIPFYSSFAIGYVRKTSRGMWFGTWNDGGIFGYQISIGLQYIPFRYDYYDVLKSWDHGAVPVGRHSSSRLSAFVRLGLFI